VNCCSTIAHQPSTTHHITNNTNTNTNTNTKPTPTPHPQTRTMPPTLPQIQALYTSTRAAASRFRSYNFQQYFVRRTEARFAAPLASVGGVEASGSGKAGDKLDAAALDAFVSEATAELAAIERAATMDAMYAGERLVVEGESSRHGAA
jgi:hypothetical protein